jgi:hypothetical protein
VGPSKTVAKTGGGPSGASAHGTRLVPGPRAVPVQFISVFVHWDRRGDQGRRTQALSDACQLGSPMQHGTISSPGNVQKNAQDSTGISWQHTATLQLPYSNAPELPRPTTVTMSSNVPYTPILAGAPHGSHHRSHVQVQLQ